MPKVATSITTGTIAAQVYKNAKLIKQCGDILKADALFHASCENVGWCADSEALGRARNNLVVRMLATRATCNRGLAAKAGVLAALYDMPAPKQLDSRDRLVASLLIDLGAIASA